MMDLCISAVSFMELMVGSTQTKSGTTMYSSGDGVLNSMGITVGESGTYLSPPSDDPAFTRDLFSGPEYDVSDFS